MRKILLIGLSLLVFVYASTYAQSIDRDIAIIPQPVSLEKTSGVFKISSKTKIFIAPGNPELKLLSGMLADQLESISSYKVPVVEKTGDVGKNAILLRLQPLHDTLGNEGYALSVGPERILLSARDGHGIFYGLQTIFQLLPTREAAQRTKGVAIPAVEILDAPRYSWRGMMLDVGRYFYPVPYIKKFIDYLAMHKLNVFHWHLTEDHGWRIEIKKYPKLTQIGAWRMATQSTPGGHIDRKLHGGYYTQEDIRDIVAYAQARYVAVVPEIELPGHSLSALMSYPELSCTGGPFELPERWGIQEDIYCAGNEQTFTFLEDVLSEVIALFPSPIIHIGGDEAPKTRWKACPKCQARIKEEGLKDEYELQSYFIKRIEAFLLTKDRSIIGWDEILEGGLAPNATVMSWRGVDGGIAAAKQRNNVVMTPNSHMYFDYYQGDPVLEPYAIWGLSTLRNVYFYEPTPQELSEEEAKHILGVQGNIWSEFIHSPDEVEYMGFPRASALAEVAWTPAPLKNWENFMWKMERQYERYDDLGINYAMSAYNVWQEIVVNHAKKEATVTFHTDSYRPQIYYTLDGSEPTTESLQYQASFNVNEPVIIKAATFRDGKRLSKVSRYYINEALLTDSLNK